MSSVGQERARLCLCPSMRRPVGILHPAELQRTSPLSRHPQAWRRAKWLGRGGETTSPLFPRCVLKSDLCLMGVGVGTGKPMEEVAGDRTSVGRTKGI